MSTSCSHPTAGYLSRSEGEFDYNDYCDDDNDDDDDDDDEFDCAMVRFGKGSSVLILRM